MGVSMKPGTMQLHANIVRRRLEGDASGKPEHAVLGSDIGRVVGHASLTGQASGHEDGAAPPLDHAGNTRLIAQKTARQVDRKDGLENVVLIVLDR
jgi:hypothetical protein